MDTFIVSMSNLYVMSYSSRLTVSVDPIRLLGFALISAGIVVAFVLFHHYYGYNLTRSALYGASIVTPALIFSTITFDRSDGTVR